MRERARRDTVTNMTDREITRLRSMAREAPSMAWLAARMGYAVSHVRETMRDHGIAPPRDGRRAQATVDDLRAALRREGTVRAAAAVVGIHRVTAARWLAR